MDDWSRVTSADATASVAVAGVLVLMLVLVWVLVGQRRTRRELARSREMHDELLARLALLERPAITQAPASTVEFVITDVGETPDAGETGARRATPATRIEGRLFADIVARETVVKAASWSHGLRHALSAENRNRLRFEMTRETKRSTRQRKADVKEALRQYYARERGDVA
ncbi:hypothetical protein [Nocardioides gilvus]|uniref:hypothetical protein n=1 Tax=Nocardioides gilvus TaxID=1735589 RepID=UPI0013A58FA7|nr:hypothetical protein [Nocardioides gilvus]